MCVCVCVCVCIRACKHVLAVQFVVHLVLDWSLQWMGQQFGKTVEEKSDIIRPVQDQSLGLGVHLSKYVKNALRMVLKT